MKTKWLLTLTLLGVLTSLIILFSLSTGSKDIRLDTELFSTQEATLYHYFSGSLSGGINEMLEKINQQKSSTQVVGHALDHEAFKSMITESTTHETAPDLFTYWAGAKTQEMVDRQLLEPIDDLWEEHSLNNRFSTAIVEAASTYNNRKYLLPITQHIVVFFYNKQLFKNAGIDLPNNWNQFIKACDKLRQGGITPISLGARERWPAQFWFDYLLLRTAGPEFRTALMRGERSYIESEVVQTYKIWSSMIQSGYFNKDANEQDWAQATEMVCKGEAAITLMGTWAIPLLTGDSCRMEAEREFDYFLFPEISPHTPLVSVGPIDGLVMSKGTEHLAIAAKVLSYASEEDPQKLMSSGSGALAPSLEVPVNFYSSFKQRLLKDIQNAEHWAFNYDLATPPEVAERGLDSFNELIAFPGEYKEILRYLHETIQERNQERTVGKQIN